MAEFSVFYNKHVELWWLFYEIMGGGVWRRVTWSFFFKMRHNFILLAIFSDKFML